MVGTETDTSASTLAQLPRKGILETIDTTSPANP